jgi:hypothetical protein
VRDGSKHQAAALAVLPPVACHFVLYAPVLQLVSAKPAAAIWFLAFHFRHTVCRPPPPQAAAAPTSAPGASQAWPTPCPTPSRTAQTLSEQAPQDHSLFFVCTPDQAPRPSNVDSGHSSCPISLPLGACGVSHRALVDASVQAGLFTDPFPLTRPTLQSKHCPYPVP